jgi:hypothetical protein
MISPVATPFRRAGSPGSTSARMADATVFRQALNGRHGWASYRSVKEQSRFVLFPTDMASLKPPISRPGPTTWQLQPVEMELAALPARTYYAGKTESERTLSFAPDFV